MYFCRFLCPCTLCASEYWVKAAQQWGAEVMGGAFVTSLDPTTGKKVTLHWKRTSQKVKCYFWGPTPIWDFEYYQTMLRSRGTLNSLYPSHQIGYAANPKPYLFLHCCQFVMPTLVNSSYKFLMLAEEVTDNLSKLYTVPVCAGCLTEGDLPAILIVS